MSFVLNELFCCFSGKLIARITPQKKIQLLAQVKIIKKMIKKTILK